MKRLITALMILSAATPLFGQSLRMLVGTYTEGTSAEVFISFPSTRKAPKSNYLT